MLFNVLFHSNKNCYLPDCGTFFLVSTEQSVDFKRRWNLRQMFQIELGSHKWSDLMKSKNGSLHFGEGRSCCPLQTCTLMIIKKKCCGNLLFCFWLRFQNNAWSLHHLQFLQIFFLFLVSPNYFHNRRMLKKMNTVSISILLNLNLKLIFDGHWQGSFVVCIPSQADTLVLVTINHY